MAIKYTRRHFVKNAAAAGAMLGLGHTARSAPDSSQAEQSLGLSIKNFRPGVSCREVGNTDIYVSALSLGTGKTNIEVLQSGLELGRHLIHTFTRYLMGRGIKLTAKPSPAKNGIYISLSKIILTTSKPSSKNWVFSFPDLVHGTFQKTDAGEHDFPGALFDYNNGGADTYIESGLVDCTVQRYQSKSLQILLERTQAFLLL